MDFAAAMAGLLSGGMRGYEWGKDLQDRQRARELADKQLAWDEERQRRQRADWATADSDKDATNRAQFENLGVLERRRQGESAGALMDGMTPGMGYGLARAIRSAPPSTSGYERGKDYGTRYSAAVTQYNQDRTEARERETERKNRLAETVATRNYEIAQGRLEQQRVHDAALEAARVTAAGRAERAASDRETRADRAAAMAAVTAATSGKAQANSNFRAALRSRPLKPVLDDMGLEDKPATAAAMANFRADSTDTHNALKESAASLSSAQDFARSVGAMGGAPSSTGSTGNADADAVIAQIDAYPGWSDAVKAEKKRGVLAQLERMRATGKH